MNFKITHISRSSTSEIVDKGALCTTSNRSCDRWDEEGRGLAPNALELDYGALNSKHGPKWICNPREEAFVLGPANLPELADCETC